jgi:hypothetical protein
MVLITLAEISINLAWWMTKNIFNLGYWMVVKPQKTLTTADINELSKRIQMLEEKSIKENNEIEILKFQLENNNNTDNNNLNK